MNIYELRAIEKIASTKVMWHLIPGFVGAGTGAIVDKKNKVRGGLIGGVAGVGLGRISGMVLPKFLNKSFKIA